MTIKSRIDALEKEIMSKIPDPEMKVIIQIVERSGKVIFFLEGDDRPQTAEEIANTTCIRVGYAEEDEEE